MAAVKTGVRHSPFSRLVLCAALAATVPLVSACMADFGFFESLEQIPEPGPSAPPAPPPASSPYGAEIRIVPHVISYGIGGEIKPGDVEVKKRLADGSWEDVPFNGFSLAPAAFNTGGEITVTVTVNDYPAAGERSADTYKVYVAVPPQPIHAEEALLALPSKTVYGNGETVNPADDMAVYKRDIYGASGAALAYPSDFTAAPLGPFSAAGPQTITVTGAGDNSGLSASYDIWVKPAAASPLLIAMPGKVAYAEGERIDKAADLTVFKRETGGTMTEVLPAGFTVKAAAFNNADLSAAGAFTAAMIGELTVTVGVPGYGDSAEYTVWVGAGPAGYAEALFIVPKKVFYQSGETIDVSSTDIPNTANDLRVFKQETTGEVTELAPGSGYTVAHDGAVPSGAFTAADEGERTVTVTAGSLHESYTVAVSAPKLVLSPQKTYYSLTGGRNIFKPADDLAVSVFGLAAGATPAYTYTIVGPAPSTAQVAANQGWTTPQAFSAPGTYTITVKMVSGAITLEEDYTVEVADTALGQAVIRYIANGGTGSDIYEYFNASAAHSLANPFTRTSGGQNCSFKGWAQSRAGAAVYGGGPGNPGTIPANTYAPGDAVTLYAKWTINGSTHPQVVNAAKSGNTIALTGVDWDASLAAALSSALTAPGMTLDIGGVGGGVTSWGSAMLSANQGNVKELVLSDVTEAVADSAFAAWTALETVSGPAVTSIGDNAFQNCAALKTADFPALETLGENAFDHCAGLTAVRFPALTTIGRNAFAFCTSLISAYLPKLRGSIPNWAFRYCTSLTSVDAPEVTSLGPYAFGNCSSLIYADFPRVTTIGAGAFTQCSGLTGVNFPKVTELGQSSFLDCSSLTSVDFPEAVTVGNNAGIVFQRCTKLVMANLPKLKVVSVQFFAGCSSLTTVNLPSVQRIYVRAFAFCKELRTLYLPSTPPELVPNLDYPYLKYFEDTWADGASPRIYIRVGSAEAVAAYETAWEVNAFTDVGGLGVNDNDVYGNYTMADPPVYAPHNAIEIVP